MLDNMHMDVYQYRDQFLTLSTFHFRKSPQTKIRVRLTLAYIPFYSYSNYYNSYTVHPHTAFQVIFALKKRYLSLKKNVPRRVRSAY